MTDEVVRMVTTDKTAILEKFVLILIENFRGKDLVSLFRGMVTVPEYVFGCIWACRCILQTIAQYANL